MKIHQKILPLSIILLYIMMMMKTHFPADKALFKAVYYPVDRIQYFLGFNQTWMMFSPNPSRLDSLVKGEVEFSDGTSVIFDFLENNEKSLSYKYLKGEKFRKFSSENLRQDNNKYLWSDASDYVLRKIQKDISKQAVKVSLIRYWNETPDWNKSFIKHGDWKENYQSHIFYSKKVD